MDDIYFLIDLPATNAMLVEDFILKHHSYKELLSFLHNRRLLGEHSYSILKNVYIFPCILRAYFVLVV